MGRILKISAALLAIIVAVSVIGGFAYWQYLKGTPAYSLALLAEEVQKGNDAAVDEFVDVDSVVEDFLPQVQKKAVELYGRGLPPTVLDKVAEAAAPLKPAIKKKARADIPGYIREKTAKYKGYPAAVVAFGIGRAAVAKVSGEDASLAAQISGRPVELLLRRSGSHWKVVAVRDDEMARQVAEKIGQDLVVAAIKGGVSEIAKRLGIGGVGEILNQLDDVVR